MAGIGAYLRQARERQGYTLEQMNSLTNIHTEYLNALENDRFDQLPSPFYAKAFLRTYAKCLGLDARPLLEYFDKTVQGKPSATESMTQPTIQPTTQPVTQPRATFASNKPSQTKPEPAPLPKSQPLRQSQPQPLTRKTQPLEQPTVRATMPAQQPLPPAMRTPQTPLQPKTIQPKAMTPSLPQPMAPQAPAPMSLPPSQPQQPAPSLEMTQTLRPTLPDLQQTMQQPLAPRRVALESKLARENGDGIDNKKQMPNWVLPVAVGALLLIGGTVYFTMFQQTSAPVDGKPSKQVEDSIDNSVRADGQNIVFLEEGGTSDNQLEGQLYYVRNADKLEVKLKGKDGESTVSFAPTAKDTPQEFTLKVGEEKSLEIGNQTQVWFRLGTPSNVEVLVNGQKINTAAQDTEKSYRVQLKK
ncbi:helix-turn-helix domain-containing protein [Laceyella putida]|uniref:Helix-turn-helix domain-containing protein n=1 Tax=Laceyella putida TaxID=110101 RepID=A0ABW2RKN9_9BACL